MKILVTDTACFRGFYLSNRLSEDLEDVRAKIYTRDIFNSDS